MAARRNRFKKHGYFCDACGAREHLEVHHVRYTNAGAGLESDRDLRVLCKWDHELAHIYEKSGEYGGFKKQGTLVRATEQPIAPASAQTPAVEAPPLAPPPAPYVVQAGDTLQRIADQSGVSLTDLLAWNPTITDPNYIEVGQTVLTAAPAS